MAKQSEAKINEAGDVVVTPPKRGKRLELRAPFVKVETGQVISGTITMFTVNTAGKFGERDVVMIELDHDLSWPASSKAADQTRLTAKKGDTISYVVKPGLSGLKGLPEGTNVRIEVVGQVDTGKGNPAWSYEVTYD